jgi:hypothetical protein
MFDTASQSGQAVLFCLCYDFPTRWSAFVNGGGSFQVVLQKNHFPYAGQSAKQITIDAITTYAAANGKVASASQAVPDGFSAALSGTGSAALTIPADPTVMRPVAAQQVFLVLRYHFGMS